MAKVTVTIPRELFTFSASIERAAIAAVNATVDAVFADFQSTVVHFDHKPAFVKERARLENLVVRGSVWTDDNIYRYLNNGTKPHDVGRAGGYMRFRGVSKRNYHKGVMVYKPKSVVGSIPSCPGGDLTNHAVVARGPWMVKGIEPRYYDKLIAEKNTPVLYDALVRAVKEIK